MNRSSTQKTPASSKRSSRAPISSSSRAESGKTRVLKSKAPASRVLKTGIRDEAALEAARQSAIRLLQMSQLHAEKCELQTAAETGAQALREAKKIGDLRLTMEAVAVLLRLASEALDTASVQRLARELESLMKAHPNQIPPLAWFNKGTVVHQAGDYRQAQKYFRKFLKSLKTDRPQTPEATPREQNEARGLLMLARISYVRKFHARARRMSEELLNRYEKKSYRGINGGAYIILGDVAMKARDFESALSWYQKAHASFLAEHSWYFHLYVLLRYALLNRLQKNYVQARWHLDLIEQVAQGDAFGLLKRAVASERAALEESSVDLLIDGRQCTIKTRESGEISLGKQYVLLHILEALFHAHHRDGDDRERGLSKAEIIETVWQEPYRPEAHDNKLYYNINRLRKLIEPDVSKPQYLLNSKDGYRLAPGLRVEFVGTRSRS